MKVFHYICSYLFQFVLYILIIDVVILKFGFGIGKDLYFDYDEKYVQDPYASYIYRDVALASKYNKYYNPKISKLYENLKSNDIKVAFFAGSTGLIGDPPLHKLIQESLSKKLNKDVFVANFSMYGGNSTQHKHMLLEYLNDFQPDIVIFYNGFNEIISPFFHDPRPNYPYNFFYVELPEWKKFLIKYSSIARILDDKYRLISKHANTCKKSGQLSEEWQKDLFNDYFITSEQADNIVKNMNSKYFGKTVFVEFFQPFREKNIVYNLKVLIPINKLTRDIRRNIKNYDYIYDVHDLYDDLPLDVWYDECHVRGSYAHILMADKISSVIYKKVKNYNQK